MMIIRPKEETEEVRERLQHLCCLSPADPRAWKQRKVLAGASNAGEQTGADRSRERETRASLLLKSDRVEGTGTLPAPTLHLSQTSARPGDSVQLQCSVLSQLLATRVIFCKDREEVSSQRGLEKKAIYDYDHVVPGVSSGNYTCGYEIKDSENRVTKSQLSPAQRLSLTGDDSSSGSVGGSSPQGPDMLSIIIWATRCTLVLLLLVSAPVITFMLEKRSLQG
ncbi:uncharacterized protein LOC135976411 [Chrysemys picta bellii]|uniref:uncharacterized protein LOC135976411 n=1 Tax=Chrysemys picta bellii TaxID=8478 RepID=UPI0032B1B2DA